MTSIIKCSNDDCHNKSTNLNKYFSKLIGDDGYYYCNDCIKEKQLNEEQQIKLTMNLYDYYLKHKKDKQYENKDNIPLSLEEVVKYKYIHHYIKHQIPKLDEIVNRDCKEYFLIEKSDLYELEVLLFNKNIKFEKVLEQRQTKIVKQSTVINEDEIEQNIKRLEEHRKEVKERPHKDIVRRAKKQIELTQIEKEHNLNKYKNEKLPIGFDKRDVKRCDYCKNWYCHPFEFMIMEKEPKRRKSWKGIICDYCIENKEFSKELKKVECGCGCIYYCKTNEDERRHELTKRHENWQKLRKLNKFNSKEYYSYKLDDLRKLIILNNKETGTTIIENYYKLKKEDLLKALIKLDKDKLLLIKRLSST